MKTSFEIFTFLPDDADRAPLPNIKMERYRWLGKLLMSGSSGNQTISMVTENIISDV